MGTLNIAILGLGSRGLITYAACVSRFPDKMCIKAAADVDPERRRLVMERYGLAEAMCFSSAEDFLSRPKMADAVFICTQDGQHAAHAVAALDRGYDVLLEKPIAPNIADCRAIEEAAGRNGGKVAVCHVLRYTPFYNKLKELLDSGAIGELVTLQHIENVGYWHQAHSFVRGNWRRTDETSFMLLAKCCHDLDLILWLMGRRCERVSSFGSLTLFKSENAPEGAAPRCLDGCKAKEGCPYDAEKIYMTNARTGVLRGNREWPLDVLASDPTEATIRAAIETGPYGRCVYHCDNDVVDHQVVNMELTGGLTAQLTMTAFTERTGRDSRFMGTKGEIIATLSENTITVLPFGGEKTVIDVSKLSDDFSGHAGGDVRMVEEFADWVITGERPSSRITALDVSMESHYAAFAAERSRLTGGAAIEISEVCG